MAPWASFLRRRVLVQSGPMAVDYLANRSASFVSAGVEDSVPVNGILWYCRLSCLLDLSPARRIGGGVNKWVNLLVIFLGSNNAISANRTTLLDELCGYLPILPLTSRHRCLFDGRICRRRIAITFACLPPPVFGYVCLDRWAFCRRDLARVFGLVHRRATWQMPAGLVGSVECGRSEWRGHWLYSLLSWRSSRLVRQLLFRQLQQGIRRRLQHSVPSPFSWSICSSPMRINRGHIGDDDDEDGQIVAVQRGGEWPVW